MKRRLRKQVYKSLKDDSSSDNDSIQELDNSNDAYEPEVDNTPKKKPRLTKTAPKKTKKQDSADKPPIKEQKIGTTSRKGISHTKATSDVIDLCSDSEENVISKKTSKKRSSKSKSPSKRTIKKKQVKSKPALGKESASKATNGKNVLQSATSAKDPNDWTIEEYISEEQSIDRNTARNVVHLLEEENSIPFIARYRKSATGGMEADMLRLIKLSMDRAKEIKHTADTVLQTIRKSGSWTPEIQTLVKSVKCLDQLKELSSIYKSPHKKSAAQAARDLGLQPLADQILKGLTIEPLLSTYIDHDASQIADVNALCDTISPLLAHDMMKNKSILEKFREFEDHPDIQIKTKSKKTIDKKYEIYANFQSRVSRIRPHQILAINRAESEKHLSVYVDVPVYLSMRFKGYCEMEYSKAILKSNDHAKILHHAITNFCKDKFNSFVERRVRTMLKKKAEKAALDVFSNNLKQLLFIPPVRGRVILGVDPGFVHGCKLAVITEQGNLLQTSCIYPFGKKDSDRDIASRELVDLVKRYQSTLVAIGNGAACRQTERLVSDLINQKAFGSLDVSYTIVNEAGASVYSVSPEAKSEFPDLDPNLISAVSIARRLQDPLAELVKVEPQSLGIGMYQHDISNKELTTALNEVVSEAVSFVGIDVNTASHCLLKRVAGIGSVKATNIIYARNVTGPFRSRMELHDVKGIGPKTFEQCIGFLKIDPQTANIADSDYTDENDTAKTRILPNRLDQTWIHPESYSIATGFLKYCGCDIRDLGSPSFIQQVKERSSVDGYAALAKKFSTDEGTIEVIVKGLSMKKDEDCRPQGSYPIFRSGVTSLSDVKIGACFTGAVRNVTDFGVFVDVGVGQDGLIHTSNLKQSVLQIGQRVEVKVIEKKSADKFGLEFIRSL